VYLVPEPEPEVKQSLYRVHKSFFLFLEKKQYVGLSVEQAVHACFWAFCSFKLRRPAASILWKRVQIFATTPVLFLCPTRIVAGTVSDPEIVPQRSA